MAEPLKREAREPRKRQNNWTLSDKDIPEDTNSLMFDTWKGYYVCYKTLYSPDDILIKLFQKYCVYESLPNIPSQSVILYASFFF